MNISHCGFFWCALVVCLLSLVFSQPTVVFAQTRLVLRSADTLLSDFKVRSGEPIELEVFVEVGELPVNALSFFLQYDATYLKVQDADPSMAGTQPCEPGPFLPGLIFQNEVDLSDPARAAILFSVGTIMGSASGSGSLAHIQFETLTPIHTVPVTVIGDDPLRATLYGVVDPPGSRSFDEFVSARIHILGIPAWDVNEDAQVDILDLVAIGRHFGENPTTDPRADVTGDRSVDVFDLVAVGRRFGEKYMRD